MAQNRVHNLLNSHQSARMSRYLSRLSAELLITVSACVYCKVLVTLKAENAMSGVLKRLTVEEVGIIGRGRRFTFNIGGGTIRPVLTIEALASGSPPKGTIRRHCCTDIFLETLLAKSSILTLQYCIKTAS